jgi:hypothetical protein
MSPLPAVGERTEDMDFDERFKLAVALAGAMTAARGANHQNPGHKQLVEDIATAFSVIEHAEDAARGSLGDDAMPVVL